MCGGCTHSDTCAGVWILLSLVRAEPDENSMWCTARVAACRQGNDYIQTISTLLNWRTNIGMGEKIKIYKCDENQHLYAFLNKFMTLIYIISCNLMLYLPAHTVIHFTICIWQMHSISPYRKYTRYGETSHRRWKQTGSLFCIFLSIPENIKI